MLHSSSSTRFEWWRFASIAAVLISASACSQATALPNGGVISSTIGVSGEQDSYTFAANAAEGIQLRIARTGTGTLLPKLQVYDPSGTKVASDYTAAAAAGLSYTIASTGTYTVVVSDGASNSRTGSYNLYFTRAPGANEGGLLPSSGQAVPGTIDLGDLDSYTITANAGDLIQLRAGRTDANSLLPRIDLYNPAGAYVGSGYGASAVGTLSHTATSTGTYTVVVADGGSKQGIGNYKLYAVRTPGANEGGTLYDGSTYSEQIDIGDLDSYAINGTAGTPLQIVVSDTSSGSLVPQAALYGPNGAQLTSSSGASTATISYTPTVTGVYALVVSDVSAAYLSTGSYSVIVTGAGSAPGGSDSDAPLPLWALGLLAGLLGLGSVRGQRQRQV